MTNGRKRGYMNHENSPKLQCFEGVELGVALDASGEGALRFDMAQDEFKFFLESLKKWIHLNV
jgi:hypothetical protein